MMNIEAYIGNTTMVAQTVVLTSWSLHWPEVELIFWLILMFMKQMLCMYVDILSFHLTSFDPGENQRKQNVIHWLGFAGRMMAHRCRNKCRWGNSCINKRRDLSDENWGGVPRKSVLEYSFPYQIMYRNLVSLHARCHHSIYCICMPREIRKYLRFDRFAGQTSVPHM